MPLSTEFSSCSFCVVTGLGNSHFEPATSIVPERFWLIFTGAAVKWYVAVIEFENRRIIRRRSPAFIVTVFIVRCMPDRGRTVAVKFSL